MIWILKEKMLAVVCDNQNGGPWSCFMVLEAPNKDQRHLRARSVYHAIILKLAHCILHQAISNAKPDVKAATNVKTTTAAGANCSPLAFVEAAEDGDKDPEDPEDVAEDEPPAVSVASWTRYTIAR